MASPNLLLKGLDLDKNEELIVERWIHEMREAGVEITQDMITDAVKVGINEVVTRTTGDIGPNIKKISIVSRIASRVVGNTSLPEPGSSNMMNDEQIRFLGGKAVAALNQIRSGNVLVSEVTELIKKIQSRIEKLNKLVSLDSSIKLTPLKAQELLQNRLELTIEQEAFLALQIEFEKAKQTLQEATNIVNDFIGENSYNKKEVERMADISKKRDLAEKMLFDYASTWEAAKQSIILANNGKIGSELEAVDRMIKLMEKHRSKDVSQKTLDDGEAFSELYERAIKFTNKKVDKITTQDLSNQTDEISQQVLSETDSQKTKSESAEIHDELISKNKTNKELGNIIEKTMNSKIIQTKQALKGIGKTVDNMSKINEAGIQEIGVDIKVIDKSLAIINELLEIYPKEEVHKVESDANVSKLNKSMSDVKEYSQSMQGYVILGDEGKEVPKWVIAKLLESIDKAKESLRALEINVKSLQEKYKGVKGFFKERLRDMLFSKDALTRKVAWNKTPKWIYKSKEKLAQVEQELWNSHLKRVK